MSMGMGMCFIQSCIQTPRQILTQSQKQQLELLLKQQQTLKHPEIPNAIRGYEGMLKADEILKQREATGVLIGSLAQGVWNMRRGKQELALHKDVDVLVPGDFKLKKDFEGGIDWFLPISEHIVYEDGFSKGKENVVYYLNGNGWIVPGTVKQIGNLKPGLYIPGRDWVIDAYLNASLIKTGNGSKNMDCDKEVRYAFDSRMNKLIKTRVPKYVEKDFEGKILDRNYSDEQRGAFELGGFNPSVWRELQRRMLK